MRVQWLSVGVKLFNVIGLLVAVGAAPVSAQAQESGPRFYNSAAVAAMKPPLSQAVRVGDILFMSGSIGIVPGPGACSGRHRGRRPGRPWTTSARCSKPTI